MSKVHCPYCRREMIIDGRPKSKENEWISFYICACGARSPYGSDAKEAYKKATCLQAHETVDTNQRII